MNMVVPPAGSYRAFLNGTQFEEVRLAKTACPMTNVTVRRDMSDDIVGVLRRTGGDVAEYYINGLASGELVPIIPHNGPDRVWAPGELFLRS
jgi:hypothetical protein